MAPLLTYQRRKLDRLFDCPVEGGIVYARLPGQHQRDGQRQPDLVHASRSHSSGRPAWRRIVPPHPIHALCPWTVSIVVRLSSGRIDWSPVARTYSAKNRFPYA